MGDVAVRAAPLLRLGPAVLPLCLVGGPGRPRAHVVPLWLVDGRPQGLGDARALQAGALPPGRQPLVVPVSVGRRYPQAVRLRESKPRALSKDMSLREGPHRVSQGAPSLGCAFGGRWLGPRPAAMLA